MGLILATLLWSWTGTPAEDMSFSNLSLEELLNVEIVSATRSKSKLSDSPIPIAVITQREIRQSGLNSIPEVLARLAEVDVLPIGSSQSEISIRGKGINFNRRLLVLIDGRSEYNDLFGVTLWEAMPIGVNDIERIEVVRGPASALFGANAFSGVINIITRGAHGDADSALTASGGSQNRHEYGLRLQKHFQKVSLLLSASRREADSYQTETPFPGFNRLETTVNFNPDDKSLEMTRITGQLFYKHDETWDLTLAAGGSDGTLELFPQPGLPREDWDLTSGYMHLVGNWHLSEGRLLQLNGYRNLFEYDTPLVPPSSALAGLDSSDGHFFYPSLNEPRDFRGKVTTNDLSLQYTGSGKNGLQYVMGLEHRSIANQDRGMQDSGLVDEASKDINSAFANFTRPLAGDRLLLGMGYRYDDDSKLGGDYGYTASLSYRPVERINMRLSARRAFRAPSLFEQFAGFTLNVPNQNHSVRYSGNLDLENETIQSIDLGLSAQLSDKFQFSLELYREKYEGLIGNPDSGLLDDIEFDEISQQFTTTTTFLNLSDASGRGGLAGLVFLPGENSRIYANYAYNHPDGLNDLSGEVFFTPEHKFILGGNYYHYFGWSIAGEWRYVGKTNPDELAQAPFTLANQTSYNIANLSLAYAPRFNKLAIYLTATNLLDDNFVAYYEFDPVLNGVGEAFGREVFVGLRYSFNTGKQ